MEQKSPTKTHMLILSHTSKTHTHTVDKIRSKYREMQMAWLHFAAGQIMHIVTKTHTYTRAHIEQGH